MSLWVWSPAGASWVKAIRPSAPGKAASAPCSPSSGSSAAVTTRKQRTRPRVIGSILRRAGRCGSGRRHGRVGCADARSDDDRDRRRRAGLGRHRVRRRLAEDQAAQAAGHPVRRLPASGQPTWPPTRPRSTTSEPGTRTSRRRRSTRDSDAIIRGLDGDLHPDFGSPRAYGIPYKVVGKRARRVKVQFTAYGDESDHGKYRMPPAAPGRGRGEQPTAIATWSPTTRGAASSTSSTGPSPASEVEGGLRGDLGPAQRRPAHRTAGPPPTPPACRSSPAWSATTRSRPATSTTRSGSPSPPPATPGSTRPRIAPARPPRPTPRRWGRACGCARAMTSPASAGGAGDRRGVQALRDDRRRQRLGLVLQRQLRPPLGRRQPRPAQGRSRARRSRSCARRQRRTSAEPGPWAANRASTLRPAAGGAGASRLRWPDAHPAPCDRGPRRGTRRRC